MHLDYYSVILMTRIEHQNRMREMKRLMEYEGTMETAQPGWAGRQFGRLRRVLGSALIAVGRRLSRGQEVSAEGNILQTKGQEVPG